VDVGVEHAVERDRPDLREDSGHRIQARGQDALRRPHLVADVVAAVPPGAVDDVARLDARDVGADLHDLADLLVAPPVDRVLEARLPVGLEQPRLRVPVLGEVGVRAAIGGQLGTGGDPRVQRAQAHLVALQRAGGAVVGIVHQPGGQRLGKADDGRR
jgi:hypothetical protein